MTHRKFQLKSASTSASCSMWTNCVSQTPLSSTWAPIRNPILLTLVQISKNSLNNFIKINNFNRIRRFWSTLQLLLVRGFNRTCLNRWLLCNMEMIVGGLMTMIFLFIIIRMIFSRFWKRMVLSRLAIYQYHFLFSGWGILS